MKRDYNRDVMSDLPVDASFSSPDSLSKRVNSKKSKINAIGKRDRTTRSSPTILESSRSDDLNGFRRKYSDARSELEDLDRINKENLKLFRYKSRRNRVIITVLTILLILEIIGLSVAVTITNLKTNCRVFIHGDVNAVCYMDGMILDEFRCPSNLQGNRIFELEVELEIKEEGQYAVSFIPQCYQKRVLMENILVYEHNSEVFKHSGGGMYVSKEPINGNEKIKLCGGVVLDYKYEYSLNANNFKMDFHIYIEKV